MHLVSITKFYAVTISIVLLTYSILRNTTDRPSIEYHAMGALCMKEPIYTLSFPSNLTDSIYSTVSMNQPINATLFPLPSVEANSLPSDSGSLNWYPDWGNTETCRNDGKEPSYMSNNPTFITNSKEDCCNNVSFTNDLALCSHFSFP